ncbi:MAG: ribosome biogenesis GTP-binding protein YihA/YsxC, partial [Clostridia bacterium]|nr:ribosome biogenesis GTP-binding protein YihA/YsxC [Clostridia bacterium]
MEIKQCKFITSVANSKNCVDYGMPEIAIAGKSNVGKSSFINYLVNNKSMAKTSSTPGKTRLLNYFEINKGELMLVDLPGYGYAKVSGEIKDNWDELIGGYLLGSKRLINVFLLVDIRHEPTALDKQMVAYMHHYHIPFCVIATKCDKLSKMACNKQRGVIASQLCLGIDNIMTVSSQAKMGKDEILAKIEHLINT